MIDKKEKGESVFVTVLLFVLIIGLVAVLLYVLNMAGVPLPFVQNIKNSSFEKALKENNYQAAYTVYYDSDDKSNEEQAVQNHLNSYFELCFSSDYTDTTWSSFRGIEIFNDLIKQPVLDKMDETVKQYYNGQYSEEDAKIYLSRLAKFSFCKEKLTDCVEEVEKKDFSDKAYSQGVDYYTQCEYEKAVAEFKKVSPSDLNRYPYALEGIELCKNEWGSAKLEEAQKMINAKNKEGATALLEELLDIFGEYEEAQTMLDSLQPELEY